MPAILTVTLNPTVDICLEVDRLHGEGKNRARVVSVQGGGGGINVARCVGRLGGSATLLYTSGREVGLRLDRLLREEGLNCIRVEVGSDTREAYVLGETYEQHSYHIVPPGPLLTEEEEQRCLDSILSAAAGIPYLVMTGSVPPGLRDDFTARLVHALHGGDTRIVLDIAGAQLREVLRERVFLIRLDRAEAARLIGRPIDSFAAARAANDYLLDRGAAHHAITTVGGLGAVYSDEQAHYEISAPPLPSPPRSDACAGDSLVSALTYRLTEGDDCLAACSYGVAAAAATVMLPGTAVFAPATADELVRTVRSHRLDRHQPTPTGAESPRPRS